MLPVKLKRTCSFVLYRGAGVRANVDINGIVRSIVWFATTLRELRNKSAQLIEKVWRTRRDLNTRVTCRENNVS